jgi:hypothetical protein
MRVIRRGSPLTSTRSRLRQGQRPGRSIAAVVVYLVSFVILLLAVSHYYLFPAIEATRDATHLQKQVLSAQA